MASLSRVNPKTSKHGLVAIHRRISPHFVLTTISVGLWIRLAERLHLPLPFGPKVQQAIWHYIVHSPALEFYELTLGRPPIRTFDRTDFDTQAVEATDAYPFTVYAFREVDEPGGRRGSCQDYDTRRAIDASAELQSLRVGEAVERFTDRLVVAGTQGARDAVLIPDTVSVDTVLTLQQYCLLERIGRSRWNGETTNGRFPLDKYNQFHLRCVLTVEMGGGGFICAIQFPFLMINVHVHHSQQTDDPHSSARQAAVLREGQRA